MTATKGLKKVGKKKRVLTKGAKIGRISRDRLSTKDAIRGFRAEHDPLQGVVIERVTLAVPKGASRAAAPARPTSPKPAHKKLGRKRFDK